MNIVGNSIFVDYAILAKKRIFVINILLVKDNRIFVLYKLFVANSIFVGSQIILGNVLFLYDRIFFS